MAPLSSAPAGPLAGLAAFLPSSALFLGLFSFISKESEDMVKRPTLSSTATSPSLFTAKIHPDVDRVSKEVDDYFLANWDFASEKDRRKFVAAGFSRVTCLYYPMADPGRIAFACKLLTVLFLIDDLLEDMSCEDGSRYNEKLIPISRGDVLPDRSVPVERITYDLWDEMRACDYDLARAIEEPVFVFMRAQTDKARLSMRGLGAYLEYRERDVGKALLSALMRFSMKLHLTPGELASARALEENTSKHISVLNDIYSWEKELKASREGHAEGAAVCSSVQVLADETGLAYAACKRVLWCMCREWEAVHVQLEDELKATGALAKYVKGLEYQMSGNERWSESTPRYHRY